MFPESYNRLTTYGCILIGVAGLLNGECSLSYTADSTLQKVRSSHKVGSNLKTCRYSFKSKQSYQKVYLRIYFPRIDPLPYKTCIETYVDIFDGDDVSAPILGRYCDMNSTLIKSSRAELTVVSKCSDSKFVFEIFYSLVSFGKPKIIFFPEDAPDTSRTTVYPPIAQTAFIAAGIFFILIISGCLIHKFCNPCKRYCQSSRLTNGGGERRFSRRNSNGISVQINHETARVWFSRIIATVGPTNVSSTEPISYNGRSYRENPPSYWAASGGERNSGTIGDPPGQNDNENTVHDTQPPGYWSSVTSGSGQNFGQISGIMSGSPLNNIGTSHLPVLPDYWSIVTPPTYTEATATPFPS